MPLTSSSRIILLDTEIVYQNTICGHKIGMIILNLKVEYRDRRFKDLMLYLFDDDILAVDEDQDITGTEMNRICPALDRRVERVGRRGNDLFAIHEHMDQLVGLVDIGLYNFLRSDLAGFLVPGPDHVSCLDRLYGYGSGYCQNQCAGNKAVRRINRTGYGTGDRSLQEARCSSVCSGLSSTLPTASRQSVCYSSRYGSCYRTGRTLGYGSDQCTVSSTVYRCDQSACGSTAGGNSNSSRCGNDRYTDANLSPVGKCKGTAVVSVVDRVIQAIGKQIVARKGGACTNVRSGISIDEKANGRIVISALQVVEPGLSVIVVATVTDGVNMANIRQVLFINQKVAPGIIAILSNCSTRLINDTDNIALLVQHIEIISLIELKCIGQARVIVDDIEGMLAVTVSPGLTNDLAIQGQIAVSYISDLLAVTDAVKTENILKRVYSILMVFVNKKPCDND